MTTPRNRRLATALLGAGVLLLAACTSPYPASGSSGGDGPDPSTSASQDADGGDDGDAGSPGGAVGLGETTTGVPEGAAAPPADVVGGAGWSADGQTLYLTTYGSSTCPTVPAAVDVTADGIEVQLVPSGGAVCSADFAPSTTAVPAPSDAAPAAASQITLGELGEGELPAAADPIAYVWLSQPES